MIRRYLWHGNFTVADLTSQLPAGVTPTLLGTNKVYTDIELLPDPVSTPAQEDLDEYLATLGWSLEAVDPTTPLGPIEAFYTTDLIDEKGDFKTRNVAAGAIWNFSFRIPSDFVTLGKLVLVGIANNTTSNGTIDFSSDYGKIGEAYNTHSESNVGLSVPRVADELIEIDISSVFSSIEAGDECGLEIDQNGMTGGMDYLGVLLEYSNT